MFDLKTGFLKKKFWTFIDYCINCQAKSGVLFLSYLLLH